MSIKTKSKPAKNHEKTSGGFRKGVPEVHSLSTIPYQHLFGKVTLIQKTPTEADIISASVGVSYVLFYFFH